MEKIPTPTVARLCKVYTLVKELKDSGKDKISSTEIGDLLGLSAHSVRKDLNYFGEIGLSGAGYETAVLIEYIEKKLGFKKERRACVVGLGRLGTAIMQYEKLLDQNIKVIAGFDSNINKVETMKTTIPVYPAYDLEEIVKAKDIEIAILTVPGKVAKEVTERLIKGGVKGIVNFTPVVLNFKDVYVTNIDLVDEIRFLSAMFTLNVK